MSRLDPAALGFARHARLAIVSLICLIAGFGSWAGLTMISGAVIAAGQIIVLDEQQIIQHPEGGVVAEILVRDGDRVEAGAILMRLEGTRLRADLAMIDAQRNDLLARTARLEAIRDGRAEVIFPVHLMEAAQHQPAREVQIASQMAGQTQLFLAQRDSRAGILSQLDHRRAQIDTQIEGIEAQLAALDRELDLIARDYNAQSQLLDRGLAQVARVIALEREMARLDGRRGELVAERAAAAERRSEISQQALSIDAQAREGAERELRDISLRLVELTEAYHARAEALDRLDLRAPVAGIVHGLQVTTPRAVLRSAEPAARIVPSDRPLMVRARLAPADIDQVFPGQSAVVAFTGLNMRDLPQLEAAVEKISADTFDEPGSGQQYYRVDLRLAADTLDRIGAAILRPGMQVELFFETGAQRPISYLTSPLTAYFSRALRES